ncbi:MAG: HK97 gp10 family phage protein [Clostridiales bacterium]|nr:HK97 gp10 family phage protein [Clostridiales bacterium]
MNISVKSKGNWEKTTKLLERTSKDSVKIDVLRQYGELGVQSLAQYTPKDTGETATAWYYTIENQNDKYKIVFKNRNIVDGVPIAIILQYGHVTRTGGWVEGRDYINPALRPIFDGMATKVWKEAIK